jgi:hypothetical protein
VAANPRVRSEMSEREEKSMALITMLEKGVPTKVRLLYCIELGAYL